MAMLYSGVVMATWARITSPETEISPTSSPKKGPIQSMQALCLRTAKERVADLYGSLD